MTMVGCRKPAPPRFLLRGTPARRGRAEAGRPRRTAVLNEWEVGSRPTAVPSRARWSVQATAARPPRLWELWKSRGDGWGRDFQRLWEGPGAMAGGPELSTSGQLPWPGRGKAWPLRAAPGGHRSPSRSTRRPAWPHPDLRADLRAAPRSCVRTCVRTCASRVGTCVRLCVAGF